LVALDCDFETCPGKNFKVHQVDQNFMHVTDGEFDFLWCRHVLEYDVASLIMLAEYRRVTKRTAKMALP